MSAAVPTTLCAYASARTARRVACICVRAMCNNGRQVEPTRLTALEALRDRVPQMPGYHSALPALQIARERS